MKLSCTFLLGALLLLSACSQPVSIVPEPVKLTLSSGHYTLDSNTTLVFLNVAEDDEIRYYTQDFIFRHLGLSLAISNEQQPNWDTLQIPDAIVFQKNTDENELFGDEGYSLSVSDKTVYIEANTNAGFVYALQTLYQLAPSDVTAKKPASIPLRTATVVDYPRFGWRGNLLDVSRHFFDVEYIKKHLDVLAMYKINKFHWHLTDDHGWRIEIAKYPKLTEIGAWRVDRSTVPWLEGEPPQEGEPATYGGYYTKEQIREIVAYAAQRNIEVIPEIEIPGHCSEILASYPEFACDTFNYYVQIGPYWPPKAIMCGGNDDVIQFFKDIVDEIVELFPSKYIHIGGDEAVKDNWVACAKCQQRIKNLKLANEEELQSWMIREVEKHIHQYGKRIIGWDEILEGGVSSNATIMFWRGWLGDSVIIKAAERGNEIIMTPTNYCYIDYYQADPATEKQKAIGGFLPLQKVYSFDPAYESFPESAIPFIKGGQANLWAEFLFAPENVEYMLLPRLLALSEGLWSPKANKDWEYFVNKLPAQKKRLAALGYNYCDKVALITDEPKQAPAADTEELKTE
ncbi:MAG: beta-N-acetylhexosaminidase [Prevotellaceae bacterium]|jgi:hexosaminidase|nr:beta-N-acetylhexosaminidase [Prevotellaceae bacterium]